MTYREALEDIKRRIYLMDIRKRAMRYNSKIPDKYSPDRKNGTSDAVTDYSSDRPSNSEGSDMSHEANSRIAHISIPAGTVFNVSNLIELSSPTGISLDFILPFLNSGNLGITPIEN